MRDIFPRDHRGRTRMVFAYLVGHFFIRRPGNIEFNLGYVRDRQMFVEKGGGLVQQWHGQVFHRVARSRAGSVQTATWTQNIILECLIQLHFLGSLKRIHELARCAIEIGHAVRQDDRDRVGLPDRFPERFRRRRHAR